MRMVLAQFQLLILLLCSLHIMCRSQHLKKKNIMSSSKGSKRISVFDRLGPGNDDVGII